MKIVLALPILLAAVALVSPVYAQSGAVPPVPTNIAYMGYTPGLVVLEWDVPANTMYLPDPVITTSGTPNMTIAHSHLGWEIAYIIEAMAPGQDWGTVGWTWGEGYFMHDATNVNTAYRITAINMTIPYSTTSPHQPIELGKSLPAYVGVVGAVPGPSGLVVTGDLNDEWISYRFTSMSTNMAGDHMVVHTIYQKSGSDWVSLESMDTTGMSVISGILPTYMFYGESSVTLRVGSQVFGLSDISNAYSNSVTVSRPAQTVSPPSGLSMSGNLGGIVSYNFNMPANTDPYALYVVEYYDPMYPDDGWMEYIALYPEENSGTLDTSMFYGEENFQICDPDHAHICMTYHVENPEYIKFRVGTLTWDYNTGEEIRSGYSNTVTIRP